MKIEYDRYELFLLFENEKILNIDAEIMEYSFSDQDFTFVLYFSPYEEFASISLKYAQWDESIYTIDMNNITKIGLKDFAKDWKKLCFYRNNSIEPVLSLSQPSIYLEYEI
jgi:hypothetical protein